MSRRDRMLMVAVMALAGSALVLPTSYAAFSAKVTSAASSVTAAGSFYAQDVKDDGAVGLWRLDGPTVTDSIGTNTGTITGTVTTVAGATSDGDGAAKTSTEGLIEVPWTVTGDVSVELSFKVPVGTVTVGTTAVWDGDSPLVTTYENGLSSAFGIGLDSAGDLTAGTGPGGSGDATIASSGTNYKDGAWHHVVWTRTTATGAMVLYADGASVATGTGGTEALNARTFLTLGADPNLPGSNDPHGFGVSLDDVATYGSVLSGARVAAHYAARSSGYVAAVNADAPVGYWRMDDSSGQTITATVGGNGSCVGSITYQVSGEVGGDTAIQLLATVGYVQVPRLVSADFSLEFWFKDSAPIGSGQTQWYYGAALVDGDSPGPTNDFGLGIDAAGDVMAGTGNPDVSILSGGTNYANGAWHYVVFTRTEATGAIALYVDGALQASNAATGNMVPLNGASLLTLGEYSQAMGGAGATIDEFAQYPLVLTPAQIAAHYASR